MTLDEIKTRLEDIAKYRQLNAAAAGDIEVLIADISAAIAAAAPVNG